MMTTTLLHRHVSCPHVRHVTCCCRALKVLLPIICLRMSLSEASVMRVTRHTSHVTRHTSTFTLHTDAVRWLAEMQDLFLIPVPSTAARVRLGGWELGVGGWGLGVWGLGIGALWVWLFSWCDDADCASDQHQWIRLWAVVLAGAGVSPFDARCAALHNGLLAAAAEAAAAAAAAAAAECRKCIFKL